MEYEKLTEKIIGCFYKVYNILGYGFLEKVYENALAIEFEKIGLKFGKQVRIEVLYDEKIVGDYVADFIVSSRDDSDEPDGKVVVEIKAMLGINGIHKAQVINYLKATGNGIGLILNFGKKAEVGRVYWDGNLAG